MTSKTAKAAVQPVRQRTQYSCMAASMAMSLRALGFDTNEDTVNRVMGAAPMKGAAWEQALACAQHYGCRATLTTPATLSQVKAWTDAGVPVMIAWNPEGREWSHASLIFDVVEDKEHGFLVYVADPNIPDPEETVRIVPKKEFYSKWYEKWPNYLVRRPACAIDREIDEKGQQRMAAVKRADTHEEDDMGKNADKDKPKKPGNKEQMLDTLARIRGKEREEYFANGGTATGWRGGPGGVTKNLTKYDRKPKYPNRDMEAAERVASRYLDDSE